MKPSWLKEGELRDNFWVTKLEKQNAHRKLRETFNFNQVVTPYPMVRSLLNPDYELDLINLKLAVHYSLKPKPIGWNRKAASAKATFKTHLAFIRWRIDRGIPSNADLTAEWFREFDFSMQKGARESLLDLVGRTDLVLSAVETGGLQLHRNVRGDVATNEFATLLGLTRGIEIPPIARQKIEHAFHRRRVKFTRSASNRKKQIKISTSFKRDNIKAYYKVWWDLWHLRSHFSHDPIGYQAFTTRKEMTKRIKSWTVEADRTPDSPPYQTSFLINAALKLLLDDSLVENVVRLIDQGFDEKGQIVNQKLLTQINERLVNLGFTQIQSTYQGHRWQVGDEFSIRTFLFRILPTAARVITAAFSARRDQEIAGSRIDCIDRDSASNSWLNCLIVKNLDRVDRVPVPESVVRAVSVVKQIRDLGHSPGDFLYDFTCPVTGGSVDFVLGDNLDLVCAYFEVPELDDGSRWHFTPHQFRKFFGITYYWRWAFPNLTALTFQYRHFNLDTTRDYIQMKAAEALRM